MRSSASGFTLIELSIVLVIIGLVAGGVLVGRELIRAAQIRQQITQIERYDVAVRTFQGKYGGLPGDLDADSAEQFGFVSRSGIAGHGDDNGVLEPCNIADGTHDYLQYPTSCEHLLFWSDLSDSKLITEIFPGAVDDFMFAANPDEVARFLPKTKLDKGFINAATHLLNQNFWYIIINITAVDGFASGSANLSTFTAQNAYGIDSKIDDGKPLLGQVRATGIISFGEGTGLGNPSQGSLYCVDNDAYNFAEAANACETFGIRKNYY